MSYREGRSYYDVSGVSAEDVIDGMNMLHREGAATKYLFRCNKIYPKGNVTEDLRKCRHYLERCLNNVPPLVRDSSHSYWLEKINPEVFEEEIYCALLEILFAIGKNLESYNIAIEAAIDHVNNAIEKY